jgi:predicted Kef-type K+ transport protein
MNPFYGITMYILQELIPWSFLKTISIGLVVMLLLSIIAIFLVVYPIIAVFMVILGMSYIIGLIITAIIDESKENYND